MTHPTRSPGKLLKLLAYALDASAGDGEAKSAAGLAIDEARRLGIRSTGALAEALGAAAPAPRTITRIIERERIIWRIPPDELVFPFGKYRGRSIGDVFAHDLAYVRWFADECHTADPVLRHAARELLASGEGVTR